VIHATLIWKNLLRNKRRSALVLLGVAVAVFVMASLQAAVDGILFPVKQVSQARLLHVREKGRSNVLASRLPVQLQSSLEQVPGVEVVTGLFTDLAVVGEKRVHIFVNGIDADPYLAAKGLHVDAPTWAAFKEDRQGAIVGHLLAAQMGWAPGALVEVKELNLAFHVTGLLPPQSSDLERHLLVHRAFLQEARGTVGRVSAFLVKPASGTVDSQVAAALDRVTSVSASPTETASEAAYAQKIVEQFVGFVDYLKVMGLITLVITVLGAVNAVSMNVRERVREIGVLRTLGFTPGAIVALVAVEAAVLSSLGGALGLLLAWGALGGQAALLAGLQLELSTLVVGLLASVAIGAIGGLVPALSAIRLTIVDALRLVD
jgi:putative ABC transport system permease protein